MEIRNIAIIAHVDHGKTTIVDAMMRSTGAVKEGAASMDSNAIEQERGITIYAKNASLIYKNTKINIIDTPGHADFGSEVERVLRSIDCVVLIVDAQEGPMPQTRFVLKKSLELGLRPIVVLNKLDKPAADPHRVHDEVLELFMELGANDEQLDFPTVYAVGREGKAKLSLEEEFISLDPLFDKIISHIPAADSDAVSPLQAQPFNLAYDNYLGRMAVVRIWKGTIKTNLTVFVKKSDGSVVSGRVTKIYGFEGMGKKDVETASAGDVVMIAGIPEIYIGDTVTDNTETSALPVITVDEPTISLSFLVNDSPFAGKEGKFVTSRQIRDRLEKELEVNVGLQVDFDEAEAFKVYGRGELHIAVLLEQMRREGFEMQVSQPEVIMKNIDGVKSEPFEELIIDTPDEFTGAIIEKLGKRKAIMTNMVQKNGLTRITFEIPTRGLLGYRSIFVVDTKGEGILASRFVSFKPYAGIIEKRATGSMVSMESGKALHFALGSLQDRGNLYITPGTEVYIGMVIGNTSKGDEMEVNPTKGKQLTNMRASGTDDTVYLNPALEVTIERGLEIMSDDEYLEITPASVRLRKKGLSRADRDRLKKSKSN